MDSNIDFSFLSKLKKTNNIKKYSSNNPLIKVSVNSFISSLLNMVELCNKIQLKRVLDAGTGEGIINHLIREKFKHIEIIGLDNSVENLNIAKQTVNDKLILGNIYNLPFEDNSMDLVISLEVLEHLSDPNDAILEIKRVTRKFAIISVPNDPIFRLGNILRGKNLPEFGNGPGHIQHFREGSFIDLIKEHFKILVIKKPAKIWLMCLVIKK